MIPDKASGIEAAVFGTTSVEAVRAVLDRYTRQHLGSGLGTVLFRAGRVDAVWGVRLAAGSDVVITARRQPVDLQARIATLDAQRTLVQHGFPCPVPVCDTIVFEGIALTAESLVTGGAPGDARDAAVRRSLAAGLAEHVAILRAVPELARRVGLGPAWCRYQQGPWPVPHDPIFDFEVTPRGFEWLDGFAAEAARRLSLPSDREIVVGHADWYAGNARFDGHELVGTFDWDLVAAPEAHIVGFAAATFTDSGSGSGQSDLPNPIDVAAFFADYDAARPRPLPRADQVQAAAAASWALAYNARCELAFTQGEPAPASALDLLRQHGDAYLGVRW